MYKSKHYNFITTPIFNILEESVIACRDIGDGIETQTISEYILQTTFLKMTGASEQKLKCICWELATNDYEYRYQYLNKDYVECSKYKDKNAIYKDLIEEIRKLEDEKYKTEQIFQCNSIADKEKKELKKIKLGIGEQKNATIKAIIDILKNDENKDNTISEIIKLLKNNKNGNKTITEIIQALENNDKNYKLETIKKMISLLQKSSNKEENLEKHKFLYDIINTKIIGKIKDSLFSLFIEREFTIFKEKWKDFFENSKFAEGDLLEGGIIKHFEKIVYRHRNRCAHNLVSYQENLPTLSTLSDKEYDYNNYFFRFSLLILIDEIFIKLYKKYIEALENNSYA